MSTSFHSVISPVGYSRSTCGYCSPRGQRSKSKSSRSFGIWAHDLSPLHYQRLVDSGWRRSGMYVYKPDLGNTCCKQISIRLEADSFQLGKSAKKCMRRLVNQLAGQRPSSEVTSEETSPQWKVWGKGKAKGKYAKPTCLQDFFTMIEEAGEEAEAAEQQQQHQGRNSRLPSSSSSSSSSLNAIHQQRHSIFVQWRKDAAAVASSSSRQPIPIQPPALPPRSHKLRTRLVAGASTSEKYDLFKRYQMTVHEESQDVVSTRRGFERFLCESPVRRELPQGSPPDLEHRQGSGVVDISAPSAIPYGLYHLEWLLEDQLIAVSVLDLLPYCLSSVYFFYDPSFERLQLGKISVLKEISLLNHLRAKEGMQMLKYYYLGYYIHNCQKMRYKGSYRPSEILDAEDNQWVDLQEVWPALEMGRGYRLRSLKDNDADLRDSRSRSSSRSSSVSDGEGMGDDWNRTAEMSASSLQAHSQSLSPKDNLDSSGSTSPSSSSDSSSSLLPTSASKPFPGILDLASLDPSQLASTIYILEAARQSEGINLLGRSRIDERERHKVRETVAALGWDLAQECIFFL